MGSKIPVLREKPGFALERRSPGLYRMLAALDGLCKILGFDLWLTAGTNDHQTGPHSRGEAIDVSVKDWPVPVVLKAKRSLDQVLGERFTVLYEAPSAPSDPDLQLIAYVNGNATASHLHLQVKKSTTYPPPEVTAYG